MKMGIFSTWCKDTSGDTSHEQSVCSLDVVPVTYYLYYRSNDDNFLDYCFDRS